MNNNNLGEIGIIEGRGSNKNMPQNEINDKIEEYKNQ